MHIIMCGTTWGVAAEPNPEINNRESLQTSVDYYFNVEIKNTRELAKHAAFYQHHILYFTCLFVCQRQ